MMKRVCLIGVVTGLTVLGAARAGLGQGMGTTSIEARAAGSLGVTMRESGLPSTRLDLGAAAVGPSEVPMREAAPLCPGQVARLTHMAGVVVLRALVGKDGGVQSLTVVSGPQPLRGSATKAVAQWRYRPYLVEGRAIEVYKMIEVNYDMGR